MRRTIALATGLLLSGCGGTPKTPDQPVMAKAGMWQLTGTILSYEGAPAPRLDPVGTPKTQERCFTAAKMPDMIWADDPHQPGNLIINGNHFTADEESSDRDELTNQIMPIKTTIEGTFDAEHFDARLKLTMHLGPAAPNVITTMRMQGHYTGRPCPPPEPAGDPNVNATMVAPVTVANTDDSMMAPDIGMMNAQ
jgi:hypothetical protein